MHFLRFSPVLSLCMSMFYVFSRELCLALIEHMAGGLKKKSVKTDVHSCIESTEGGEEMEHTYSRPVVYSSYDVHRDRTANVTKKQHESTDVKYEQSKELSQI